MQVPLDSATPHVDVHLIKFSQISIMVLTAVGFILQVPVLILITALALALSAGSPGYSPFRVVYQRLLVPAGVLRARIVEDDPAPHRFAQGVGALFLIASSLLLFVTSATVAGWVLALIVFVLAGINVTTGFCAGCFVYFQLGRVGLLPRVRYAGGFRWRGVQG